MLNIISFAFPEMPLDLRIKSAFMFLSIFPCTYIISSLPFVVLTPKQLYLSTFSDLYFVPMSRIIAIYLFFRFVFCFNVKNYFNLPIMQVFSHCFNINLIFEIFYNHLTFRLLEL